MKRYLLAIITTITLVSCILLGCDSNEYSQAEIEALRTELEQLEEEKRIETISTVLGIESLARTRKRLPDEKRIETLLPKF